MFPIIGQLAANLNDGANAAAALCPPLPGALP